MKGFGKRLAACLLLISLLAATVSAASLENCPGGCTHAATIGTTHYDTLAEALDAATDSCTVTLLTDIADSYALSIEKAITLDLGGKTLSGINGSEEGLLNISADFTIKNGKVTTNAGTCLLVNDADLTVDKTAQIIATEDAAAVLMIANSPVIMNAEAKQWIYAKISGQLSNAGGYPAVGIASGSNVCWDVTIDSGASIASADHNALEMYDGGKLTVTGGNFQAKQHAIVLDVSDDLTMEASITGGTFQTGEKSVVVTKGENATVSAGFVTGGTYNQVPTEYIPSHCGIIDNGDGTYTVVSSFTLSFQANGGSGTMAPVTVNCGSSIKLPKCSFTAPKDMDFAGWKIGDKTYAAGDSYIPANNVTAIALWKAHVHSGGKATCQKKAVCSTCGASYGKLADHKLTYINAYDATCSAAGMNSHSKCTVCGKRFVSDAEISAHALSIPALGHSWETVEGSSATCLEEGLLEHQKCADCGILQVNSKTVAEADLVVPTAEHTLEAVAAVEATCTNAGVLAHERCSVCGALFQSGNSVEADTLATAVTSHVLSDWHSDEVTHWKACVDCGEVFRQKSHTDSDLDGVCNDCGYTMTAPQQAEIPDPEGSGFNWLFLIPILAAIGIAVPLALKKRK